MSHKPIDHGTAVFIVCLVSFLPVSLAGDNVIPKAPQPVEQPTQEQDQ